MIILPAIDIKDKQCVRLEIMQLLIRLPKALMRLQNLLKLQMPPGFTW